MDTSTSRVILAGDGASSCMSDSADFGIRQVFLADAHERVLAAVGKTQRFVYYTQAATAVQIVRNEQIWMRKASCMNDFMEVQYGLEKLAQAYNSSTGGLLKDYLEANFAGITEEVERLFNGWAPRLIEETYLTCVSEHLGGREDLLGRLSMWRAYGGSTGVALVLNNTAMVSESDALKAYSSPVEYLDQDAFDARFQAFVARVLAVRDLLQQIGKEQVLNWLVHTFRFWVLCTKHPGFSEEREWRIVHNPTWDPSKRLVRAIEVVGNVPQPVFKIPLQNVPEEGLFGLAIPELLDRVIIGPTEYPNAVRESFIDLLEQAGVPGPEKRVFVSDIPLR